jgi:hypothetical protein
MSSRLPSENAITERATPSLRKGGPRSYILLFLLLTAVYNSNLRPIASADSLPGSLIPFSVLLDGSIRLDRFGPYVREHVWYGSWIVVKTSGHWYSGYPIAGPILATPLYLPLAFVPGVGRQSPATLIAIARIAEKVVAAALAAATALPLLFLLRRIVSRRAAWFLTLIFAFGTGNWSTSSQALWQHTFGGLAIVGWLYSVERLRSPDDRRRWCWAAGVCAGCALAIRPTNGLLLPVLAFVLWVASARAGDYFRAFFPAALAASVVAVYNLAAFHHLRGGYEPVPLNGNPVEGLLGLLFSPGRGLLIYTPIVLFALAAFAPRSRETLRRHRLVVIAASLFSLLHIAFFTVFPMWWGGFCWGPRLLTEIMAPIMVLIAVGYPAIRNPIKPALAALAVYCCFVQALGVYCYPKGRWDQFPISVDRAPERLWNWKDNPLVRTARGGIAWEPYSIAAAAARGGPAAAANRLQQLGINPY